MLLLLPRSTLFPYTTLFRSLQVIGDVGYHDYEGSARSPEEGARFLADLGDRHIMVLRNHGLLIIGTSIAAAFRSEEHTSELQSHSDLVCRLLLEKKKHR